MLIRESNLYSIQKTMAFFALRIVTPWGQNPRSGAWFWEVSGKRKRSRLPPEYSPPHASGERP